ncbi:MAG: hypothetical protein AAF539_16180, partial [Planctomycetota bacterium]
MNHSIDESGLPADDPRVTAYVLGELSETERVAFENDRRRSPELDAMVRDSEQLVKRLGAFYDDGDKLHLSSEHREAILSSVATKVPAAKSQSWKIWTLVAAMSACLIGGLFFPMLQSTRMAGMPQSGPGIISDGDGDALLQARAEPTTIFEATGRSRLDRASESRSETSGFTTDSDSR